MAKASRTAAKTANSLEELTEEVRTLKGSMLSMHSKMSAVIKRLDALAEAVEAAVDAPDEGGGG